jgi:carbonic anhydrase
MEINMITAREALDRLKKGNGEFVSRLRNHDTLLSNSRGAELLLDQNPFATIVGCSDSRVPTEIIFNQGFGDLFVIRVAGNIVAPSQVGSVEYAAAQFDAPLVVVLGHSQCGAILATIDELKKPAENQSPNLRSIVNRVRPSVEVLMRTELRNDPEALVEQSVQANVFASVDHLKHGSALLEQMIARNELAVVGAEYSLETGVVTFFDSELTAN